MVTNGSVLDDFVAGERMVVYRATGSGTQAITLPRATFTPTVSKRLTIINASQSNLRIHANGYQITFEQRPKSGILTLFPFG